MNQNTNTEVFTTKSTIVKGESDKSRRYVKLSELTEEQQEKGIYVQLEAEYSLKGTLTAINKVESKFGKKNQLVLTTGAGTELVLDMAGNLNKQIEKSGAEIGDDVEVAYLGKFPIKEGKYKGTKSHTFKVAKI